MEASTNNTEDVTAKRFANLSLDIGTYLLASGAHCGRLNTNIKRMAITWGFDIQMQPTFRGLLVTVQNLNDESDCVTMYKDAPSHTVHLQVLTDISRLSWKVYEDKMNFEETEQAYAAITQKKHYSALVIALAVGISCAGLCLLASGDCINALLAFIGAFVGYTFRHSIAELKFNAMISISIAAFITTLITGLGTIYGLGENPEVAMATAVLYLIPGVPLINCVIDLIEGYLSSSINRALFAGFILLCIAAGMTLCITLLGINNFNL
ncbi:MAG: threonine/serine exporter ThrE family protein [Dysgonomonas sp.]